MDLLNDNEMRFAFEGCVRQMRTFFSLKRAENGDYLNGRVEVAWRGFMLGYAVGFNAAHDQSPTFTVTPDARELAEAYQSVNPDYPSPATYREAE
jgi:hypothetical protein